MGANAGLLLLSDAWLSVIRPNGNYYFILEDFGNVRLVKKYPPFDPEVIVYRDNISFSGIVINIFSTLQDYGHNPYAAERRLNKIIYNFTRR